MSDIKHTFRVLFLIGTLILILGFILVWIPQSGISGLKEQLSQATLNSEKVGLERVISVESLNLVTFYQPVSNILEAVGSIVIGYSILTTTFDIAFKDRSKVQFQQDVSQSEPLKFYPKLGYEKVPALSQET
jgi:hypothetical protein